MRLRQSIIFCLVMAFCLSLKAENAQEMLQRVAQTYAENQAMGGNLSLRLLKTAPLPRLKGGQLRIEPSHLSKKEPYGQFFTVCKIFEDGHLAGFARVDFEGRWKGQVMRLRENVGRKMVPSETQLSLEEFEGIPPMGAIQAFPAGFRLRIPLASGRIITRADLEAIPLISAGDPIRFTLQTDTLSLSQDAIARSNGMLGEKITLEMKSGKRLQAFVVGPGEAVTNWRQ